MFDRAVLELPGTRRVLAALSALALLQAALVAGQAYALSAAVVGLWEGGALADQAILVAVFAGCFFGRQVVESVRSARLERFAAARAGELRDAALAAVFSAGPALVRERGTGAVTALVVEGVEQVETYLAIILPKLVGGVVVPVALLACALADDWVTALIMAVFLPVAAVFMVIIGRMAHDAACARHREFERLSSHFVDTLRGIDTLAFFGRVRSHAREVFRVSERFRSATVKTLRVATLSSTVLDLIATFALAAVSIMLGFRLVDGSLGLFAALFALIIVPEYFKPLREFAADYHASLDGANALRGLRALAREGKAAAPAPALVAVAPAAPDPTSPGPAAFAPASAAPRSLELRGVSFSYSSAPALAGVSLAVSTPCRVGIVGASGSGKTTLVNLLAGFSDPASGELLVDGAPLPTLCCDFWQRNVLYLPQSPYLFHATLRENIAFYCPDAPDEALGRAVRLAGLDELVEMLPQGLDTLVGEGARQLSGGQAQRVALARALLDEGRRVLLFDEPTAHLDIETELELKERMLPIMEGRLVFFATHRLHWVADMDRVIVLDKGRVAAFGAPDDAAVRAALARLVPGEVAR